MPSLTPFCELGTPVPTREDPVAVSTLLNFSIYVLAFKSPPQIGWKLLATLALMMYDFGVIGSFVRLKPQRPVARVPRRRRPSAKR